jgi:hypothetical protein
MLTVPARREETRFRVLPWAAGALVLVVVFFVWRSSTSKAPAPGASPDHDRSVASPPPVDEPTDAAPTRKKAAPPAGEKPAAEGRPQHDAEPAAPTPNADAPEVAAVLAAAADRSPGGTQALIASLTSSDEIVVAEATKALIDRRATEAITPLSRITLKSAAGSGLSIIDALGRLGGVASDADRSVAVDRLLAMLAEEKARGARESPGNLIQIYEALGHTRDPRAAPPLEAELLDERVPRAPKVVIVASLVQIGQESSRAALEKAHAQQSSEVGSDAFEEEIRVELVGAIAKALEDL